MKNEQLNQYSNIYFKSKKQPDTKNPFIINKETNSI